jgi:ubiquinone/menaquinone biosynthesis C-methylase UbiE
VISDCAIDPYENLSNISSYELVNRKLVDFSDLRDGMNVIDIGCGTGSVTDLVLAKINPGAMYACDPDDRMISVVRNRYGAKVDAILCGAENMDRSIPDGKFDLAFLANCIHLVESTSTAFVEISKKMRCGGSMLFNTAFHQGAEERRHLPFFMRIVAEARRILNGYNESSSLDTARNQLAKRRFSLDYYRECALSAGLSHDSHIQVTYNLHNDIALGIVSTPIFASAVLPGFPVDQATRVLREVTETALKREGEGFLTRKWLYVKFIKVN